MRTIAAFAVAVALWGQDPRFGVQSRLVMIPVTVTDAKGQSIDGLEPPDFLILDNGRPQTAVEDAFATGVAPIALVVAVQSSGISAAVLAKVQKIAGMIQPLITGERGCAALVAFDEAVRWYQECTNDYDALTLAFRRLQPGEHKSGRMLDAVHEAIEHMRRCPNARRVVFVISESRDRSSETSLDSVVMAAQAAAVTVYAASYSAFTTAFTAKPSEVGSPPPSKDPPRYEPKPPPSPKKPADCPYGPARRHSRRNRRTGAPREAEHGARADRQYGRHRVLLRPAERPRGRGRATRNRAAHAIRAQFCSRGAGARLSPPGSPPRPPHRLPHPRPAGYWSPEGVR